MIYGVAQPGPVTAQYTARRGRPSRYPAIGNQAVLRRLQAKLTIGGANDPLEHEADAVAEQVMRMPDPALGVTAAPPRIRRKCDDCEEQDIHKIQTNRAGVSTDAGEAPDIVHNVLNTPGQPLDQGTRNYMEPRFGCDFGDIRVHTGTDAAKSARAVGANAYTVGRDMVFGEGQYAPGTLSGTKLLAHELTHATQQNGGVHRDAPISVRRDSGAGGAPTTGANGRPLTSSERDIATFVFGPALNLDPIVIKESAAMAVGGYIRTLPDTIYVSPGYKIGPALLMHELTHCAQYQHGVSRLVTAAYAVEAKYDYGGEKGLLDAIKTKKCFDHFNTEQQADIVRDYYLKVVGGGTTYPWSVFIDQVRAQGACNWPTTPTPTPTPPPKGSA